MPLANDLLTPTERGTEGCKGLSAKAITSFSTLRITALPVVCQSPARAGRKGGRSLASTEYSKRSSPQPRDLRSVVAQPLMVRMGNLWQATSSLCTFYLGFWEVLWVTQASNFPSSSSICGSSGCLPCCPSGPFFFIFKACLLFLNGQ